MIYLGTWIHGGLQYSPWKMQRMKKKSACHLGVALYQNKIFTSLVMTRLSRIEFEALGRVRVLETSLFESCVNSAQGKEQTSGVSKLC